MPALGDEREPEDVRWRLFIGRLSLNSDSRSRAVVLALEAIYARWPRAPYPSAGAIDDIYHLTWAYRDEPDITFSVEINSSGRLEWFFRDRAADVTDGSDDTVGRLPDEAIEYVGRFRPRP